MNKNALNDSSPQIVPEDEIQEENLTERLLNKHADSPDQLPLLSQDSEAVDGGTKKKIKPV